jgi:hypothetical protein
MQLLFGEYQENCVRPYAIQAESAKYPSSDGNPKLPILGSFILFWNEKCTDYESFEINILASIQTYNGVIPIESPAIIKGCS